MFVCPHCQKEIDNSTDNQCPACGKYISNRDDNTKSKDDSNVKIPSINGVTDDDYPTIKRPGNTDQNASISDDIKTIWGNAVSKNTDSDVTIIGDGKEDRNSISLNVTPKEKIVGNIGTVSDQLPDYELINIIGEGGIGVVYSARQTSIDRIIALKVIKTEFAKNDAQHSEFFSEASVIGNLDHPNVVPVYDLGINAKGQPFYSMKQVKGSPWKEVIKENNQTKNLGLLKRVCDALAYAHSKGFIHRDIKPENVMLGEFGEVLLMDWGMAVSVSKEGKAVNINDCTAIAGTPSYMAPEMAKGDFDKIGIHCDIYLLGATLFEIVTGKKPHTGKNVMDCLENAAMNNIQAVKNEDDGLVKIAQKAMATNPDDRYKSVRDFQNAIDEYQKHEESIFLTKSAKKILIQSQLNRKYHSFANALYECQAALKKWKDNETAIALEDEIRLEYGKCAFENGDFDLGLSLLSCDQPGHDALCEKINKAIDERNAAHKRFQIVRRIATTSIIMIFCIMLVAGFWIQKERNTAVAEKERAVKAETVALSEKERAIKAEIAARAEKKRAERLNYFTQISLAENKFQQSEVKQGLRLLKETQPKYRGWEYGRLLHLANLDQLSLDAHEAGVASLAFSPDGQWVISAATTASEAKLWELRSGKVIRTISLHGAAVSCVDFSPDNNLILTGSWDKTVIVFDRQTGEQLLSLNGHQGPITAARFNPTGDLILTSSVDGTIRIWDALSGLENSQWVISNKKIHDIDWSPDSTFVAAGIDDGRTILWEVQSKRQIFAVKPNNQAILRVLFSNDGSLLFTGAQDGSIRMWNTISGKKEGDLQKHQNAITSLDLSPDAKWLVSGSMDQTAIVWNLTFRKPHLTFKGHNKGIQTVAFHPGGKLIATGGNDGFIKLWHALKDQSAIQLTPENKGISSLIYIQKEELIFIARWDGSFELIDAQTYQYRFQWKKEVIPIISAVYNEANQYLHLGRKNGSLLIWKLNPPTELNRFQAHDSKIQSLAVSSDGKLLASGCDEGKVKLWDVNSGNFLYQRQAHSDSVQALAFSPDNSFLATGGLEKTEVRLNDEQASSLRMWKTDYIKETYHYKYAKDISSLVFSPNGQYLLTTSSEDQTARLWKAGKDASNRSIPIQTFSGHAGSVLTAKLLLMALAFSLEAVIKQLSYGIQKQRDRFLFYRGMREQ